MLKCQSVQYTCNADIVLYMRLFIIIIINTDFVLIVICECGA